MCGDVDHYIKAKTGQDMTFATEPSKNFMFENGDINQTSGYHVATSNIIAPDANGLNLTNQNGNGLFVDNAGNVGIGTSSPSYPLDISGDIRFTGQLYDANGLFKPSPWETNDNNLFFNS